MNIEFENKLDIEEMKTYLGNSVKKLGFRYFDKLNKDIPYPYEINSIWKLLYIPKISKFNKDYILNKISNMQNIEDVLNVLQLIYQLDWDDFSCYYSFFQMLTIKYMISLYLWNYYILILTAF